MQEETRRCLVLTLLGLMPFFGFGGEVHGQGYIFNQMSGVNSNFSALHSSYGYAIAQGDFNHDGRLDFAVVEKNVKNDLCATGLCDMVSVYLAQVNGTYQLASSYQTLNGGLCYVVAVGDVNGDGKIDLVYISEVNYHGPNSIVVQLGNGDGTFQAPIESDTAAAFPDSLVLRDFNGDGILDVALVDGNFDFETGNGDLYVHIGNKNGTFQPGVAYPISVGGGNSDLITADLNGDKILDLVVSGTYGTAVLIGAKGGTFGTSTIYKYGGGSVAVADMNKDGKLDLIAGPNGTCSYGCQVSVLLGNGDGTFGTVVSTPVYGNFTGLSLVTGDFNHDGRTDIAFGGGWAGIEVLLGNGQGGFYTPVHAYGSFTTVQYGGPILLTGDYNLDGQLDLVSLPYPFTGQSFSILSGNGDGTFGAEQDLAAGSGPSTVVTGDFNNDGKLDLAVTSGFTSGTGVGVFLGKGNGTFKPALVTVETSAAGPMVSGDFNHDGKLDLALVNKDNTVSILLGTGTGAFTAAHTYSVSKTGAVSAIATADFNHDGNFDLVLVDTLDSTAWVLLGNSDGTFQNATSWNTYYGGCYSVAVADLNGDGNPDIAATCGYTYISLLFGNGDGTFSSPSVVYDPSAGNSGFNVALADLQGNGVYDLIGSHLNNLWVALGAGNGGFPSSWIQNWGGGYSESLGTPTAIADFNNDGKVDIAEAGLNSFAAVAFGNGDGTFQPEMMYAVPLNVWNGNAYSVVLGDFNNDGSLDMAVASSGRTGTVTVILSNPVAVFSAAKLVFGKVTTGSSSALELTVTDQSPTKLTIKGITISGKGASEYSQTNTCGTVVTPYGSCTVTVRFSPSAIGTQNALLNFADSAAGKTRTISLIGTGQ